MSGRDYDLLFEHGRRAVMEKLLKNEHKRGFENIPFEYAYIRLCEEMEELQEEVMKFSKDLKAIRLEVADVLAFGLMLIVACDRILEEEGNEADISS